MVDRKLTRQRKRAEDTGMAIPDDNWKRYRRHEPVHADRHLLKTEN